MENNLYSSKTLSTLINNLIPDPQFFLNSFPNVELRSEETIVIDETKEDPLLISPYSSPRSEAPARETEGYKSSILRCAYLKEKRVFQPDSSVVRLPGEQLHMPLSNKQRLQLQVVSALKEQLENFRRRKEVMASQIINEGKLHIQEKNGKPITIDFGRDKDLTKDISGDAALNWNSTQKTNNIADQLEEWSQLVLQKGYSQVQKVVFGANAWKAFRKHPSVKEILDLRRADISNMKLSPQKGTWGLSNKGTFGEFDLYLHTGQYRSPLDGELHNYVDPDSVLLIGDIDGTIYHGPILDLDNDMKATQAYFTKKYTLPDPSTSFLLSQSSLILYPKRVNSAMKVKVV